MTQSYLKKVTYGLNETPIQFVFFRQSSPSLIHKGEVIAANIGDHVMPQEIEIVQAWVTSLFLRGVEPVQLIPSEKEIDKLLSSSDPKEKKCLSKKKKIKKS